MENKPAIFSHPDFGKIRTAGTPDRPLFCLADVCKALDISNSRDVKSRLNQKGVVSSDTLTNGGNQKLLYINEPNLYKCIFQSRKADAERFQDWVFEEVLPTIRKTGSYQRPETMADIFAETERLAGEMREDLASGKILPERGVTLTAYDVAIYSFLRNGIKSSIDTPFCVTNTMISKALGIDVEDVQPAWERLERGGYIVTRKFGDKRAFILGIRQP